MLLEFSVENYMSFKDKVVFSMVASSDKSLPDNFYMNDKYRILKSTAIYGANASGKTNLFKAINFVIWLVKTSNVITPDSKIPVDTFKLSNDTLSSPTSFEIKLLIDNIRYEYDMKLNEDSILEEKLYYYPNGRPVKIFTRVNTDEYDFNVSDRKILNEIVLKNTNNKLFLTTATTWNYSKTKPVFDFFNKKVINIFDIKDLNNVSFSKYYNDQDRSLEKFALMFLKTADIDIDSYLVTKDNTTSFGSIFSPIEIVYNVKTIHKSNDCEATFDLTNESSGTQVIFSMIPILKDVLDNGKVLIIDELDRSLHPMLLEYIVKLFNDSEINTSNAQLIFNTHDINLLDLNLLRRDQYWFTDKDPDDSSTTIYPLDQFEKRKNENIQKGYLLSRYGGIPFINGTVDDIKEVI